MTRSREDIMAHLNAETGRIEWKALVPHFARGQVVRVASGLDLLQVAAALAQDDQKQVNHWMEQDLMGPVPDEWAGRWQEEERQVWAVVVAPWVLVQEVAAE